MELTGTKCEKMSILFIRKATKIFPLFCFILLSIGLLNIYAEDQIEQIYLSETRECQFTPALKELAERLEYNPVKIFNWVLENIQEEGPPADTSAPNVSYGASRKGAHCTYLTRSGNTWDQCALLTALLRISNVPTRYVKEGWYIEAWISADNYRGNGNGDEKAWFPLAPNRKWPLILESGIDLFPDNSIPPGIKFGLR